MAVPLGRRPSRRHRPRAYSWHALRTNGITDKVWGYGSLLAKF